MAFEAVFRVVTFILHFSSAIFLLSVAFRCSSILKTRTYTELATDPHGYAIVMTPTCENPYARDCFYGLPQSYDVIQHSLGWNVFALLSAFEWLSASFALHYLDDVISHCVSRPVEFLTTACIVWNIIGIFVFAPYSMPLSALQTGITWLSLFAATAAQIMPMSYLHDSKHNDHQKHGDDTSNCKPPGDAPFTWIVPPAKGLNTKPVKGGADDLKSSASTYRVTQHYTEYCTSAALLFVAVLILFVPDPVSWAPLFGFVGIMICNIAGIGAHNCKIDGDDSFPTAWYDLDWTKCGNHFKLFMLHSWLALAASMFIIIYLAHNSLTSSDVPTWVRFILWNLLVTYTLFGVWATVCYAMAGHESDNKENFSTWMRRLDVGLTILSAAAKLPVAYTVFYGLIQEPGGNVCDS
jgi:hypothetical protein